jgi:hypothetical protein
VKQESGGVDLQQVELTLREVDRVYHHNAIDFPEKPFLLAQAKAAFLQDILFYLTQRLEGEKQQ